LLKQAAEGAMLAAWQVVSIQLVAPSGCLPAPSMALRLMLTMRALSLPAAAAASTTRTAPSTSPVRESRRSCSSVTAVSGDAGGSGCSFVSESQSVLV